MFRSRSPEGKILLFSVLSALFFSVLGTAWGLITGSLVILFDGMYSLVSVVLSLISLAAARYINKADLQRFHFGRARVEPLVIAFKGAVLLIILSLTFTSGIQSILNGGNNMEAVETIGYGVINVLGCLGSWLYIRKHARQTTSGLAHAEAAQWVMDTALSAAVMIGFLAGWLLEFTPYSFLSVYADPVLAIIVTILFVKEPLAMLMQAMRELLMMAPDKETSEEVLSRLKRSGEPLDNIRMAKVGRELHLSMDYAVDDLTSALAVQKKLRECFLDYELRLHLSINLQAQDAA